MSFLRIDWLIGPDGQSDERDAMINSFLFTQQTAVCDEKTDLWMTQQILLWQPRHEFDVSRNDVVGQDAFVLPFPYDTLRQSREGRHENVTDIIRNFDPFQNRSETDDDKSIVTRAIDKRFQILIQPIKIVKQAVICILLKKKYTNYRR